MVHKLQETERRTMRADRKLLSKTSQASSNQQFGRMNAGIYVLKNGCKRRGLAREYGNRHTIYTRIARQAKRGVLQNAFLLLQERGIIEIHVSFYSLDSAGIKVHPPTEWVR